MDFEIMDFLSEDDKIQILELYQNQKLAINHHPNWEIEKKPNVLNKYALLKDNNIIVFYSRILESHFSKLPFIKTATINFPFYQNKEVGVKGLLEISNHYKAKKYTKIDIQLYYCNSNENYFIEQSILKKYTNYILQNNISSLEINLHKTIDSIQFNFKNVLKKNIKSSINKGVYAKQLFSNSEYENLERIYSKMYANKNISINKMLNFNKLVEFIKTTNLGYIIGVFSAENILIGGVVIITHNNRAEYLVGATHPEFKKLPSSHIAILEAIKIAKNLNCSIFDMGGYVFDISEKQEYKSINDFKYNFTQDIIFYPKKIEIQLNRIFYCIYKTIIKITTYARS